MNYILSYNDLSAFFALLVILIALPISIYTIGYLKELKENYSIPYLLFFKAVFITSMVLTIFSSNIISFMFFWEIMSISSFFLVIYEYKNPSIIRIGVLYFIMAHLSGILIMITFGLLYKYTGTIYFDQMRNVSFNPQQIHTIFYFSLAGFGAKAGLFLLHVWLPEAHPAAPSNISALMSGIMLKVAIYGFILINFYVLNNNLLSNGLVLLILGGITAFFGISNAIFQKDIKKLLAYSSIENIGIIFSALGLSMVLNSQKMESMMVFVFASSMLHVLNHAVFKSLLFSNAGSVLYATHTKDINELGGLHKVLKYPTFLAFIGAMSMAGIPPLNGFASESLIFRSFIESSALIQNENISMLVVSVLSILALTSAMAVYSSVKYFGITFLGEARSEKAIKVRPIPTSMNLGMAILSIYSIVLGLTYPFIFHVLQQMSKHTLGLPYTYEAFETGYEIILISFIVLFFVLVFVRFSKRNTIDIYETWGCGFNAVKNYMQYSGDGLSQPVSRYFGKLVEYRKKVQKGDKIALRIKVRDAIHVRLYMPVINLLDVVSSFIFKLHYGKLQVDLLYLFIGLALALYLMVKGAV